jgi:hypothetical protein
MDPRDSGLKCRILFKDKGGDSGTPEYTLDVFSTAGLIKGN